VAVRYSRGADFSGTCYYRDGRIFINLGRHVRYPYRLGTHIAKSESNHTHWWRPTYYLTVRDGYQLSLFIYLHELYHYLVKAAGRNPKRKESRCDRFATRVLVDQFGCALEDARGAVVARRTWDFQDLHGFVARAPKARTPVGAATRNGTRQIPVRIHGVGPASASGLLFEL
jgi:hypothetical protein